MQWVIVGKDGIIVEVMEVVGVEGSRVLFERYLPLHDTVLKRYRVAIINELRLGKLSSDEHEIRFSSGWRI